MGRVLFTDESRFSLSSDSHRILIWRERGSRNHPSNIIERDRYGGRGVLVLGGIMLGSRTDLHIFDAGSVNGTHYCNEILLPYVRLFRGAMGLQFLFMDDNAPCHRTVAAEQLLESRRLAARTLPPVTIRELRLALEFYVEEEVKIILDRVIRNRKEQERSKQEEKEREERIKQEEKEREERSKQEEKEREERSKREEREREERMAREARQHELELRKLELSQQNQPLNDESGRRFETGPTHTQDSIDTNHN
ncbi:transposable element Tcb1 transposase [Trichonephila clavipes]|nr:transposable element Tcb1 transposase [Trichonephila clavipes]